MGVHFEYKGQHFELPDGTTPEVALTKIKTHLGEEQQPIKEQKTTGPDILGPIRKGAENIAGGVVGVGDFIYGGVKAIPPAVLGIVSAIRGNKPTEVMSHTIPKATQSIEEIAPSLGSMIQSATGKDPRKTSGYKWMHDEPLKSIEQGIEAIGNTVLEKTGNPELAAGSKLAIMGGMAAAPIVKGAAPKPKGLPPPSLTSKSGFPFSKQEVPNNFVEGSTATVQKFNREQAVAEKIAADKAAIEAGSTPQGEVIGKQFGGREAKPWDTPEEARVKSSFEMELVPQGESGLFEQPKTPETSLLAKRHDIPEATIDFPLRQEVLQQPEIIAAIEAFRTKAAELQKVAENAISEKVRENSARELEVLQQEFAAGMKQLGVDDAAGAHGLNRPLYETGVETQLPINKTVSPLGGVGKKQGGALDPNVFKEGLDDLNSALSRLTDKIAPYFQQTTNLLRNQDGTPAVYLHATRKDLLNRNSNGFSSVDPTINEKLIDSESFDPRNISPKGDLGIHLGSSATSPHVRMDPTLSNIGSTFEGIVKSPGWEKTAGHDYYGRDFESLSNPPKSFTNGGHIFPYVVTTQPNRVVRVSKDVNNWADPISIITLLEKEGIIPQSAFRTETGYLKVPTIQTLRSKLISLGIDAIEYPNAYENIGAARGTPNSLVVLNKKVLVPLSDAISQNSSSGVGSSTLGGPGKKQGGAINFGAFRRDKDTREKVSIEGIMEQYEKLTGQKLTVDEAVKYAKEANLAIENVTTKLKNKGGGFSALNKKLGNPFTSKDTLTPEELKIALSEGLVKDIDTNFFTKLMNAPARLLSNTYQTRNYFNNPVVEAVFRPLSNAADAAKYRADHILWGLDGAGSLTKKLNKEQFTTLSDKLLEIHQKNITVDEAFAGQPKVVLDAAKAWERAFKIDLEAKNASRALEGKKPLTPLANYLAGSWRGDRVFTAFDSAGEMRAVVTGTSKDLEVARNWIQENHPDWLLTDELSNVRVSGKAKQTMFTDNLAELYDTILKASEDGKFNAQEAIINVIKERRDLESAKVRGVHLHEKYKKETPVLGAEGFKPWQEKTKNAEELFSSQLKMVEDSILREELTKASQNILNYEKTLGKMNAIELAKKTLGDMQGNYDPIGVKQAEQRIRQLVSNSSGGQKALQFYRFAEPATTAAMNTVYFAGNALHMLVNILETGKNIPLATLHGMKEVPFYKTPMVFLGALRGTEHMALWGVEKAGGPKLSGDFKYFHDYAMGRNIGNPTVEIAKRAVPRTVGSVAREGTADILNATISLPEIGGRYTAFVTVAHNLKSMGLTKEHAAQASHDLVKVYFKDYSSLEAAPIFKRLGDLGMGGRQLRTWVIGETLNYYSMIANRNPALFATAAGLSALIYGIDSVPGFKQLDELWAMGRELVFKYTDDPEKASAIINSLTPREYLYTKANGDLRGLMDKTVESTTGVAGSSIGSTEFRILPEDMTEVLVKVKYLLNAGKSLSEIIDQLRSGDPQGWIIAKNLAEPVAPKIVPRMMEIYNQKTETGNILNEKNELRPNKTIHSKGEEIAYKGGWQPKTTALQRQKDDLDLRKRTQLQERKKNATDKLVKSFNLLQLDPKATTSFENASRNFIKAYGGSNNTNQAMRMALEEAVKDRVFSKEQWARLQSLGSQNTSPEVIRYYIDVLSKSEAREMR